jgi:E3 ubiquitin-protein ligase SHPRH
LRLSPRLDRDNDGVDFKLPKRISDTLIPVLEVAGYQAFDPGEEGNIWASMDVTIKKKGTLVTLELCIDVIWNESLTIWGGIATVAQRNLRDVVLRTWFPDLQLDITKPRQSRWPRRSWSALPQDFYKAAYVPNKETYDAETESLVVPGMKTKLYPFQRRAVQWLLRREGVQWCSDQGDGTAGVQPCPPSNSWKDIVSFKEAADDDGNPYYVSPLFGAATRNRSAFLSYQTIKGGILAE